MPARKRGESAHRVRGVDSLAGEILFRGATTDLDPKVGKLVREQLGEVLPGRLVQPGQAVAQRRASGDDVLVLLRSAAVTAAGLDAALTPDPPEPLLWEDGANRLLIRIAGVSATLDDGLIELTLPVFCEESGEAEITVAFVTEAQDQPTGGICITEDHPRGPAVIIENWHEALIAFAWHTVVVATGALSGVVGADASGQSLVTASISVSRDGLAITPMARHLFGQPTTR